MLIDARTRGLETTLWIDGTEVARDFTPAIGEEAVRNHRLAATLADGRSIDVEAGYINYSNAGIAVRVDDQLIHESHPGKTIAFPARAAKMVRAQAPGGKPAYDLGKLKRNKVPILVDVATTLLFFVIAKFTDLRTAALAGAAIGLALLVIQRFVRVDLIGGMALFGIFMLLVSAGFALAFEDDELIKQRSTIVGLIGGGLFPGRWLARREETWPRGVALPCLYRHRRTAAGAGDGRRRSGHGAGQFFRRAARQHRCLAVLHDLWRRAPVDRPRAVRGELGAQGAARRGRRRLTVWRPACSARRHR